MEVQDVALHEFVVKVFEGDVEFVASQVVASVVRGDRRDPVMDDDLGVERVAGRERGVRFCGGRDHLLSKDVEGTRALLDRMPRFARVHRGCRQGKRYRVSATA